MEEIIIDGVDVSECKFFTQEQPHLNINCLDCLSKGDCNNSDCYYKQLKRLEQENEKLKKENQKFWKEIRLRQEDEAKAMKLANEYILKEKKIKEENKDLKQTIKDLTQSLDDCNVDRTKLYKEIKLIEKNTDFYADLFNDEYFKGLTPEQVIELAKKSIRITTYNRQLETALEEIRQEIDDCEYADCGECKYNAFDDCRTKLFKDLRQIITETIGE